MRILLVINVEDVYVPSAGPASSESGGDEYDLDQKATNAKGVELLKLAAEQLGACREMVGYTIYCEHGYMSMQALGALESVNISSVFSGPRPKDD